MIYFVRAGEEGPVKIGRTKDVERCISALQTSHFAKLTVIRTLDAPGWVEGWLHDLFAPLHVHGGWFTFTDDMLAIEPPGKRPQRKRRSREGSSRSAELSEDQGMPAFAE